CAAHSFFRVVRLVRQAMAVEMPRFSLIDLLRTLAFRPASAEFQAVFLSQSFLVGSRLGLPSRPEVDDLAHGYFLRKASSETTSAPFAPAPSSEGWSVSSAFLLFLAFFGFPSGLEASASRGWNSWTGDSFATAGRTSSNS